MHVRTTTIQSNLCTCANPKNVIFHSQDFSGVIDGICGNRRLWADAETGQIASKFRSAFPQCHPLLLKMFVLKTNLYSDLSFNTYNRKCDHESFLSPELHSPKYPLQKTKEA